MRFLDIVRRARSYLEEQQRVSLRALRREFELDDAGLEELVDELVEVQRVAVRDGTTMLVCVARTAKAEAPRAAPLPEHLADKIRHAKPALEGERKQVSVLFADVKGSMELAEQLDPEAWSAIMQRFFTILADGVERFEGFVDKFTGDGIMALFGAPIAHEDHAQRACYAALHLRAELARHATEVKRTHGLGLSTRIGIHSGEVIVGRIGDDLRMDYTAQGHTVGLAQRMEALASPDTCYLTGTTTALVRGYFETEDLGDFQVKGVQAPTRVHRLIGVGAARTRFDVSRGRGLTRFVGRDADMATLEAALEQAQAGHGQVVGVVAEAGTGKSRLCFEFAQRCRGRGMAVNEGHAVAHGKNIPYLPMLQVFRGYYGITEQDDDRTAREKIAGRLLLLDESFRDVLPVLFEFFGVPDPDRPVPRMDPDAKQRQLFAVLRRLVQGADPRGARGVATLIEDLHWIDPGSEVFLEQWVDAIAGSASFLLLNFRPEYHAAWMQKSYYRQLPLAPLGPDAIRKLLEDLLGSDPSTRGLADAIHARTGGNPFFTEEVVQMLIESGNLQGTRGGYRLVTPIERLAVPASVQAVLAARIDRLPEREKRVLQAAAVIGKEFAEPILLAAAALPEGEVRAALATLKTHEFVYEQALYPVAEYAFKHPLTQEVALGSQLQERRRWTHATVARALEAAHAEKLDEQAALLAHHWEEAGEALAAARWHRRAGEWLWMRDVPRAFEHFGRVRTLTAELLDEPEGREHGLRARYMLLQASWRVGLSHDELERLGVEGREIAARLGDVRSRLDIEAALTPAYWLTGQLAKAARNGEEVIRLADELGDMEMRAFVRGDLGHVYVSSGRLDAAVCLFDEALELGRDDPRLGLERVGLAEQVWTRARRGWARVEMGSPALGVADLDVALRRARELGQWEIASWTLMFKAFVDEYAGNPAAAVQHARESLECAARTGSPFAHATAYWTLGRAHLAARDARAAREAFEQAQVLPLSGDFEPDLLAGIAEVHLIAGEGDAARASVERAIRLAQERGTRAYEAYTHLAQARVLRALDGASAKSAIEACLGRAEALIAETGARAQLPFVIEERARLALDLGDAHEGARLLREAQRAFEEVEAVGHATRLAAELGL
jgi:class 3 adenylate cyclase/tetratricopeptide (TPR) repeat protein